MLIVADLEETPSMPVFSNFDITSMPSDCSSQHNHLEAETNSIHAHDVESDEDQTSNYMSGMMYKLWAVNKTLFVLHGKFVGIHYRQ